MGRQVGDHKMKIDGTMEEEEQLIYDNFKKYLETRVAPNQERWNAEHRFPREIMKDIAPLALPATIPESLGGGDISETSIGLMSELMGNYEFPVPAFLTMHFSKLLPLIVDSNIRTEYVKKYLNGDLVICGAFTEPGHGSDSASIDTQAIRQGNEFKVSGEKSFVSSPGMADVHIVSAKSGQGTGDMPRLGLNLVIVDGRTPGVEPYELESMAKVFDGDFGGVRFDDVMIPEGNLIGKENGGFSVLMKILNVQRVHVALYSIGLAERSLAEAIEYAKIRKTFNKPISAHQAVAFRLAEDWTRLESVKLLAYKALAMQEKGVENSAECAAVKWHGCEVAFDAVSHSLQTFGASGYVKSSAIERRFRAARGFLIGDGTPDIQKLIISRKLFGRENAP